MFNTISTNEKDFTLTLLKDRTKPIREDSRDVEQYRNITIKKLPSNGQVEVCIGNTRIISQIYAKVTKPFIDHPNEGMIVFTIDTNHLKPNADYNQCNETLNEFRTKLNHILEKSLKESKALDANSLCIVPGKLIWKIVIDVNIINYDGNAIDAAFLGALASWCSFKIPFLRYNSSTNHVVSDGKCIHLSILHKPFCVTFGMFYNGNCKAVCDPTWKEEKVMNGYLSVTANVFGEVCYMQMTSSILVSREYMEDLLVVVNAKVKELNGKLKEFLKEVENEEKMKMDVDGDMHDGDGNGNGGIEDWKSVKNVNKEINLNIRKHFDVVTYKL